MSVEERERRVFEAWIVKPPYQKDITRWASDHAVFPNQYRCYDTQLAWEAWWARTQFLWVACE